MSHSNVQSSCQDWLDKIDEMLDAIEEKLDEGDGKWGDLPGELREKLKKKLQSVEINCYTKNDSDCQAGIKGRVKDSEIYLCPGANEATLLHELVHVAGGEELDAEAIENHLYPFKSTDPTYDDFLKFIEQDKPCKYTENKRTLLASKFVIWDPKNGKLWTQIGSRSKPKKGEELDDEFKADSSILDKLAQMPLGECGKEQPEKCGAACKDFETYGYCDRKVYQPPCWQHRTSD
jgi:hypothetical protein